MTLISDQHGSSRHLITNWSSFLETCSPHRIPNVTSLFLTVISSLGVTLHNPGISHGSATGTTLSLKLSSTLTQRALQVRNSHQMQHQQPPHLQPQRLQPNLSMVEGTQPLQHQLQQHQEPMALHLHHHSISWPSFPLCIPRKSKLKNAVCLKALSHTVYRWSLAVTE